MKKIICLIGFLSLLMASCSSSDSSANENDVLVKRSVKTYTSSGNVYIIDHTYNGKKALKSTNSNGNYETYTYTGDLISHVNNYNSSGGLYETETFTYNTNDELVTYVRAQPVANTGVRTTFVYNSDGTVSTASYSGTASSQTTASGTGSVFISGGEVVVSQSTTNITHVYTYDTKNNPFKNITGFDKIMVIGAVATGGVHHNMVRDDDGSYVYNTAYTYNNMNFPLTATLSEGTETISTTEYIYY